MALSNFRLAADNPNDSIGGGGCLCSPNKKAAECEPPYVIFHGSETSENASPHAVICRACLQAAVGQLRSTPSEELPITGRAIDMAAQIAVKPDANVQWSDLSAEEQVALAEQFPQGGLTKLALGDYVEVPPAPALALPPAERPGKIVVEAPPSDPNTDPDPEDPLVQLVGDPPQQEPGDRPGEYVSVREEQDE